MELFCNWISHISTSTSSNIQILLQFLFPTYIVESYCQLTFRAILKGFHLIQVIYASAYQNTFLQFNSELLLKNKTLLRNFFHSKPTLRQNARRPVRSFLSQRDSLLQKLSIETYWFTECKPKSQKVSLIYLNFSPKTSRVSMSWLGQAETQNFA